MGLPGLASVIAGIPAVVVALSNENISETNGGLAEATYQLTDAGIVNKVTILGGTEQIGQWVTPASGFSNYEARATVDSGALTGGSATGSWLSLGTTRAWTCGATAPAIATAQITVEIRDAGSLQVLTSAVITLTAEAV